MVSLLPSVDAYSILLYTPFVATGQEGRSFGMGGKRVSETKRLRRADLRMSEERLRRYQQAAALEEISFSAFALRALDVASEQTLRRHRTITISEEAMRAFVEDLLNPGEPGERLKRYAQMHREMVSGQ